MGYWGWRPLILACFISVWVVGCTTTSDGAATTPTGTRPAITLTIRIPPAPTATPVPAVAMQTTPLPTLTPQASPTPVTYVAQSGDTLLGIALRFGVELAALQAANGGIDPITLQIGQELVIPDPQITTSGLPILPTATAEPLPLTPPSCFSTPASSLVCLGQVENTRGYALERLAVLVQLLDSAGRVMMEQDATIEQALLPAGEAAPYRALFRSQWEGYAGAVTFLRSADRAQGIVERFAPVLIEAETSEIVNGRYIISATLHNAGSEGTQPPRLIATVRDEDGQVSGYRVLQLEQPLEAGERRAVQVEIIPRAADAPLAHTLRVEARRFVAQETTVPTP